MTHRAQEHKHESCEYCGARLDEHGDPIDERADADARLAAYSAALIEDPVSVYIMACRISFPEMTLDTIAHRVYHFIHDMGSVYATSRCNDDGSKFITRQAIYSRCKTLAKSYPMLASKLLPSAEKVKSVKLAVEEQQSYE